MHRPARRLVVSLSPLLLMAACSSGQQHTTRLLNDRLQAQLAPDVAAGNAVLQPLPNGAVITLPGPSLFPANVRTLDDQQRDPRAGVIEGLLDPKLMSIQIADTSALPEDQRDTRIHNVERYFITYGLAPSLAPSTAAPPAATQAAATPAGLTITISLQCPARTGGAGYGDGKSKPVCD
jgi:hypothetical protein